MRLGKLGRKLGRDINLKNLDYLVCALCMKRDLYFDMDLSHEPYPNNMLKWCLNWKDVCSSVYLDQSTYNRRWNDEGQQRKL